MATKWKKIRSCHQAWGAYRAAFNAVNWLMSEKPKWTDASDKEAIRAYQKIIAFERSRRWHDCFGRERPYLAAPDWVLYRLAYQDAIVFMNRLGNCKDVMEYMCDRERDREREFVSAFAVLLKYSRTHKLSDVDNRKLYQYTRRFDLGVVWRRLCAKENK